MLTVSIHWALEPFRASVQNNEQHNWKTNYSALVVHWDGKHLGNLGDLDLDLVDLGLYNGSPISDGVWNRCRPGVPKLHRLSCSFI